MSKQRFMLCGSYLAHAMALGPLKGQPTSFGYATWPDGLLRAMPENSKKDQKDSKGTAGPGFQGRSSTVGRPYVVPRTRMKALKGHSQQFRRPERSSLVRRPI